MAATAATKPSEPATFDVEKVRRDFPILAREVNGHPLVYLDNAASGQKPRAVIDTLSHYYETYNANIHRGVHHLSMEATDAYERARAGVQRFLNAARPEEIVFVRGATEGINLVAQAWGRANIGPGDEIILSTMEHHSNIVPWQLLAEQVGATIRVIPITDSGEIVLDEYEKLFTERTKMVGCVHVSNALGTINPVKRIVEIAHAHGAKVLIDGAQAAPHLALDVQDLGADFYVITGHKMCGPTGIGALYGRFDLLDAMPPYQGGGEMILSVSFDGTTYNKVPHIFEAGTPDIAGAIGLGAAVTYLEGIGMDRVAAYEHDLLDYGTKLLAGIPEVKMIGTARDKAAVLSFLVGDIHPHDIGTILDQEGIAVRTGHHCAQPVMDRYGIAATVRASLSFYNTTAELDALAAGIRKAIEVFG